MQVKTYCILALLLTATVLGGCTLGDKNKNWSPKQTYPAWAYDAPFYYRPTTELAPIETIGDQIPVYYTDKPYFFVRHPGEAQLTGAPRVAVWASTKDTRQWHRAGYYGIEQTHFLYKAEEDGPQWIRFIGPGQQVEKLPPGKPHRIYVVDTEQPDAMIQVLVETPDGYYPAGEKPPAKFGSKVTDEVSQVVEPGEMVKVRWNVDDDNLVSESVRLSMCFAKFPVQTVWSRYPDSLATSGVMSVEIPAEAQKVGGVKFRLEAKDKAGNVTVLNTRTLTVAGAPEKAEQIDSQTAPDAKPQRMPGWPRAGEMLRGGEERTLRWMPEQANQYQAIELEFSHDDGRLWDVVASGRPNGGLSWTAPNVSTNQARLRIVGQTAEGNREVLAITRQFEVYTPPSDVVEKLHNESMKE